MVNKYFSSILCSSGYCCAYNTLYKQNPSAKVYIINGDDFEKATFFSRLIKALQGYSLTLFNPFYDEATDGIYIDNLNTYILSDGGYNKIMPILPGIWEKYIDATENKNYPQDLIREILIYKNQENNFYRTACKNLKKASIVKERLHAELSPYLNEEKVVNYIHRIFAGELKLDPLKSVPSIRLLSSPTPLGIHTHYDTIFHICDKVINIIDDSDFVGSIILGVIKNYALQKKIGIIASPTYFNNSFFQFLIFPQLKYGFCVSDSSHILPFQATKTINASNFLTDGNKMKHEKIQTLISVENKLLEKAVISIYEGRDERFKYNNLVNGYSKPEEAQKNADILAEKILN